MKSGESPFLGSLHGVMNGDRPYTDEQAPKEPTGGKDVSVDYVRRPIDDTGQCEPKENMRCSPGDRLSHHWDLLGHVDGSATVRENGCLSTATSSTGNGSLATTIPSVRGRGATCAKVWNVVNQYRKDCIFVGITRVPKVRAKFQHWDSDTNT